MSQSKRAKRPKIARAEPRRNFASAFTPAESAEKTAKSAQTNGVPPPNGKGASRAGEPGWTDARDASYEAINSGYRVIDEYMRQGQRLAEEFWLPSPDAPDAKGVGSDFTRMMDRFLRSAGDMGGAWLEMMTQWTQAPGRDAGGPRGTAGPFSAGTVPSGAGASASGPDRGAAPLGVSFTVETSKRVRLSVDARTLSARLSGRVALHALVCSNPEVRPIASATLEPDPAGGASLRVIVPDDQPAGTYYGVLVDTGTGQPGGTVTLTVL
jgi:hypothetical protein